MSEGPQQHQGSDEGEAGAPHQTIVFVAAVIANVLIATTKFIAAGLSGSSALLSEGIHSVVDGGNGVLLLFGRHLSRKPADETFPLGRGKEMYFWTLVVAMVVFAGGGCVSFYEGVLHVLHPHRAEHALLSYAVLGASAVFEAISLTIALREVKQQGAKMTPRALLARVRRSKDPSSLSVVFEDSAAVAGVVIAAAGVFLSRAFDAPELDGVASMVIGVLLALVALLLGGECRSLLIGERAHRDVIAAVRAAAADEGAVVTVDDVATLQMGPRSALVHLALTVRGAQGAPELVAALARIEARVRRENEDVDRLWIHLATSD